MIDHLSYSSISAFAGCPRKHYLHYQCDFPSGPPAPYFIFGRAFHQAIEGVLKKNYGVGDMADSFEEKIKSELEGVSPFVGQISSSEEKNMIEKGRQMCRETEFQEYLVWLAPRVIVTEFKFKFEIAGIPVPIIGYIDAVYQGGNGLAVVDFKTTARKWSEKRIKNDMQAPFYYLALREHGFDAPLPGSVTYAIITKAKTPKFQEGVQMIDNDSIRRLYYLVRDMWGWH